MLIISGDKTNLKILIRLSDKNFKQLSDIDAITITKLVLYLIKRNFHE